MFSISHMIVLFIVVLVVFGPHKLPELARGLGKLMAEFRKASTDFKVAFEEEMRNVERQAREAERKKQMDAASASAAAATAEGDAAAPIAEHSEAAVQNAEALEPVVIPATEAVARGSEETSSTESLDAAKKETSSAQELQEKALQDPRQDTGHPA